MILDGRAGEIKMLRRRACHQSLVGALAFAPVIAENNQAAPRSPRISFTGRGVLAMKRCVVLGLAVLLAGCSKEAVFGGKTVTQWRQVLQEPSPEARREAATALGEIGAKAKAAVPDLAGALKDR